MLSFALGQEKKVIQAICPICEREIPMDKTRKLFMNGKLVHEYCVENLREINLSSTLN